MSELVTIETGKTYIIEIPYRLTPENAKIILGALKTACPDTKFIVLDGGAKLARVATDAEQAIERVRELHKPFEQTNENGYVHTLCAGCYDEDSGTGERFHDRYPCPTIQALDGEQE